MKYYQNDQIKEDEVGGAYNVHARDEKCVQNFGRKNWRTRTTRL